MFNDLATDDQAERDNKKHFLCVNSPGGCRAPVACGGFGYCRERNFDGAAQDDVQRARRQSESDAVYAEFVKGRRP